MHNLISINNNQKRRCMYKKHKIDKNNDQFDRNTFIYDLFATPDNKRIVAIGPPSINIQYTNLTLTILCNEKWIKLKPNQVINDYPKHYLFIAIFDYEISSAIKVQLDYKGSKFNPNQLYKLIPNSTPKYRFAVTTKILNESCNIVEWIEHYLKLGAEQFFIYDNNSTDRQELYKVLKPYFERDLITLIDWSFPHGNCTEHKFGQFGQINHCIYKYGWNCEWLFIGDVDEYIVPKFTFNNSDFINKIISENTEPQNQISCLKFQMYWFGVKDDATNMLMDRNRTNKTKYMLWRTEKAEGTDSRTKCIIRPSCITLFRIHEPKMYTGYIYDVPLECTQLNHYYAMTNWRNRQLCIEYNVFDNSILQL